MSGSAGVASTLLSGNVQAGGSLVQALYAGIAGTGDPLQALRQAAKNQTRDVAATEKQPEVARDIAAFKAAIAKAKTATALVKDPAFLKVLLTANGLGDQLDYPALARRALLADAADANALVNKLPDTRWKAVNKLFDFAKNGLAQITSARLQGTLADGYAEIRWRDSLDQATPGLSDALTFRARAAGVTSALQILGDPTLRRVVTTALKIPQEIAYQPISTQERAISLRLDVSRLKDSRFVDSFTQRYLLAVRDANQAATGRTATDPAGIGLLA